MGPAASRLFAESHESSRVDCRARKLNRIEVLNERTNQNAAAECRR
jgi:hypothetical protein